MTVSDLTAFLQSVWAPVLVPLVGVIAGLRIAEWALRQIRFGR